jgi:hypothetical protein
VLIAISHVLSTERRLPVASLRHENVLHAAVLLLPLLLL